MISNFFINRITKDALLESREWVCCRTVLRLKANAYIKNREWVPGTFYQI